MPFFTPTRTKNRNWNILDTASSSHKDELLKDLIICSDQEKVYDSRKIDSWFFAEMMDIFSLFDLGEQFKSINSDIKVFWDYSGTRILPEIIITSPEYKKSIFDEIMDFVFDFEDEKGITPEFYYIAEKQLPQDIKELIEV